MRRRNALPPGTVATLNGECPWPARVGLLAVVMDTEEAEHVYPVHGLGPDEEVIHISEDPLERPDGPHKLANGLPWSCVIIRKCLDVWDPQPHGSAAVDGEAPAT